MASSAKKTSVRSKPRSAKSAAPKNIKRAAAPKSAAKKAAARVSVSRPVSQSGKSNQSDAILKMGTDAVRQMMSVGNKEAQAQIQKQMMSMSQESAAQLAKSADAASRSLGEMMAISKDNMDAAVTCSSIAVNASKHMGAELFNYANKSFSQNVEMSKEIFGCRTLNDMFDLQSKVMKTNLDHFFNESVKMSEMLFKTANQVSEPLNQRVSVTTQRISKSLMEAA